jgi:transposase
VPGIGKVLALTILYEIHDASRFPSVRDFASYSHLVKCERSSAGKSLVFRPRNAGKHASVITDNATG